MLRTQLSLGHRQTLRERVLRLAVLTRVVCQEPFPSPQAHLQLNVLSDASLNGLRSAQERLRHVQASLAKSFRPSFLQDGSRAERVVPRGLRIKLRLNRRLLRTSGLPLSELCFRKQQKSLREKTG